jgi:hypothetical protein
VPEHEVLVSIREDLTVAEYAHQPQRDSAKLVSRGVSSINTIIIYYCSSHELIIQTIREAMKRILGRLSPYRTIEGTKEKRNEACFFPPSAALAHISSLLFVHRPFSTTFFSLAEHLLHQALIKSYNKHNHSFSSHCDSTTKLVLARLSLARKPKNGASHRKSCRPRIQTRRM